LDKPAEAIWIIKRDQNLFVLSGYGSGYALPQSSDADCMP